MACDTISIARAAAALTLLFAGVAGAEPAPSAGGGSAPRLEVREDAAAGRLIRQVRYRRSASPKPAAGGGRGADESVVQGIDFDRLIRSIGGRYGVNPKLIHAVIRQESNYDPFAVSPKGALGLMQLLPATAERFGVKDVFVPAENIQGGVKYLRYLMDRYPGQAALVLAAYNAGEGAVDRYGGVPPYRETQAYIARIAKWYSPSRARALPPSGETGRRRITASAASDGVIVFATR